MDCGKSAGVNPAFGEIKHRKNRISYALFFFQQ